MNKMKRAFLLCTAFFGLFLYSIAHPVDPPTAQSIAAKFMATSDLQLVTTYQTDRNAPAFYVFNTTDGFVIVSADDCETPIIGYSHEGRFDPNNVPVQMEEYLQDFVARIQYGIENHIVADEVTAKQWALVKATGRLNDHKASKAVAPLLTEKWHQGCFYNSLCPTMSGPCDHAEAGCVAVAMGQIMHYWGYPTTGWGSNTYASADTVLSADFGNTTYDWSHMPDSLTENSSEAEIEAIATLLLHCGISVGMRYSENGSSAKSSDVRIAMRRYFDYSKQIHLEKRSKYNDQEWLSLLKGNLDLQRPIYYSGSGNQGSHAFVCDGYDDNDMLHFNWGWGVADGYFALGNLNPIGFTFNKSHVAILDIIPHYDPCHVIATASPSSAGTIVGDGEYHIGEQCTLTVTPADGVDFYCWKQNGRTVSNDPSYTFNVESDTIRLEACFCLSPVGEITASYWPEAGDPNSSDVNLTWSRADTEWKLLKQFEIPEELGGMATDGEHIYVTYAEWNDPPFEFGKYTMNGDLVEQFNLPNINGATCIAYDGTDFYCNCSQNYYQVLYHVDLDNKTVIDSTNMGMWFGTMAYDPENDGFWLGHNTQAILYSRQGQRIKAGPLTPDYINGMAYYTAQDGNPHLLLSKEFGVYDYDINSNFVFDHPLLAFGESSESLGACIGTYDGQEAMFVVIGSTVHIYEVRSNFPQIVAYRICRANSEGYNMVLVNEFEGSSYTDETWESLVAGQYRYGIRMVYANGNKSETVWSNFIKKTDYAIDENDQETPEQTVQKVFEDGKIVIVKDGKRYTVTGQQLN